MQAKIKLSPTLIKELAKDVFLEIDEAEIKDILAIEKNILHRFEKVFNIETKGVEPLFYPFEAPRDYLRNDDESQVVKQSAVLANARHTIGPYVAITRVVK